MLQPFCIGEAEVDIVPVKIQSLVIASLIAQFMDGPVIEFKLNLEGFPIGKYDSLFGGDNLRGSTLAGIGNENTFEQ